MIVTRVGGLPEIVPDGRVGLVCEPDADSIATAMQHIYSGDTLTAMRENFTVERKRFSWATMCDKLEEVYNLSK